MTDTQGRKWDTSLIVTDLKVITSGTNRKTNAPYTLYQVTATKPTGEPIPAANLRTFTELPKHEVIEVQCSEFHSEQYGTSITLTPKGKSQSKQAVAELKSEVAKLKERMDGMGKRIVALEEAHHIIMRRLDTPSVTPPVTPETYGQPPQTPAQTPPPPAAAPPAMPPSPPPSPAPNDDDIPF